MKIRMILFTLLVVFLFGCAPAQPAEDTVAGDDFDSDRLANGQAFSHTFTEAGRFTYRCNFHAAMIGTVTVV